MVSALNASLVVMTTASPFLVASNIVYYFSLLSLSFSLSPEFFFFSHPATIVICIVLCLILFPGLHRNPVDSTPWL